MEDLMVWLEEKVWVGHNIAYDIRMLKQEFDFAHTAWNFRPLELCTQNLSWKIDATAGNKLEDVAPRWGVLQPFAHRAVADAKVSGQILQKMIAKGHLPNELGPMETMRKEAASAWHRRSKGRR
jgi:DNA polymerase III alpha subunit (gram-positive type)